MANFVLNYFERALRSLDESSRYYHDVRPSVCPSGTGVHCDHTVHVSADLRLWLDSPMF